MAKRLDALQEAAAAVTPEARLRHLVAAWRAKHAPELAEHIETLGAELDRPRPRIAGKTVAARLATWLALEQTHDETLTGWLLASPPLEETHSDHYRPRLARVAKWRPDPRLASALVKVVEDGAFAGLRELWDPLFRQLAACADARTLPRLKAARKAADGPFFTSRIDATIKAITAAQAKQAHKLSATEKQLLAKLGAPGPSRSETELLAAIYAAPADDGARLVYADHLQQRSDPRGELIALQCKKTLDAPGRQRVRQLLAKHKLRWTGPLEQAVMEYKKIEYERGFLSRCHVCVQWGMNPDDLSAPRERAIRALQDHPAWATLREVSMTKLALRTRAPLIAHLKKLGVKVTLG